MRLFPKLRIAQKLPLVVLGAALLVGSAIGAASYVIASRALEAQARQNLATIAFERANQLGTYLASVQADVAEMAKSETIQQSLRALTVAYAQVKGDQSAGLRQAFIADNPNEPAERLLLDKAATPMNYNTPHSRYQPLFRDMVVAKGYRDLYLFDVDGRLVYSVHKADDFALSFAEGGGTYAASALGSAFRKAMALGSAGGVEFADFSRYGPIAETPVAFFAAPVYTALGAPLGVLAVALTPERLSAVIGYRTGLGATGDTTVVGIDGLARSNSSVTEADDVLTPAIFDPVIKEAVTGVPGETTGSFRGQPVLAAAAPVDVTHNQSWGLVATMSLAEVFAPISRLGMTILTIGAPMLLLAAVLGWLFSRSITTPIGRLTRTMGALADGDLTVEVRGGQRSDEIGAMARAVEVFRENGIRMQEMTEDERVNEAMRREDRARMMQDLQRAFGEVVDAAVAGDFSRRVEETFPDAELNLLAESVNNLVVTVDRGLGETVAVLASLAHTDLTARMSGDYHGAFGQLRDDLNAVGERLTSIVLDLRNTSRALKSATGELLSGANDLSNRTTRQASTIEETSAAMAQLASTVLDNATRAEQASVKAKSVADTATEGGVVMQRANDAMEKITTSSGKISSIIGLIDDIAFQTNLLALNASVEAARAGDAGRGFAVVAVEVRRLAQSAAQASNEVKALIQQSSGEVTGGSKLVAEAAAKLLDMLTAAQENSALIEAIARASREQASAIEEVSKAVRTLDEMTAHNAALVEETNAAIEQSEAQAQALDRIVEVFTVEEAGRRVA
jgi:methyl-accepting chemotaxis protein